MRTALAPRDETPAAAARLVERHSPGLNWWPTLFGLAVIAGCVALDLAMLRDGLDELDEGYFIEQATRVIHGQLPYRDFEALYTPGLLYVHAWLFDLLGGPSLVVPRLVSLVGRIILAVAILNLTRQLVNTRWAVLPPLMLLLGLDTIPGGWEPHPGWYSAAATALATLVVASLPAVAPRRHTLWLVLAGAATALVFLFKQNAGVFAFAAAFNLLLVRGLDISRPSVTRQVRVLQVATVAATLGVALWLTRPFLGIDVAVVVLSPLLAASLPALRTATTPDGESLAQRLRPLVPFSLGFSSLTLLWLVPLFAALDLRLEPLAPFIGAVDQANLYFPLELPSPEFWFARPTTELPITSLLLAPERFGAGLAVLLPVLGAWAGAWIVSKTPPGRAEWRLQWLLFAGALAFLTEYPRMDIYHLAWSAPILLVV
ncbi:MAG TPA: hypothetical protein VGQ62_13255, partial [Chloroflexota bacterium]|nr:hypothetical protein [Chloroflexota bacterium]